MINKEYLEKNYRWATRTLSSLADVVNEELDSDIIRGYIKDLAEAIANGWDHVAEDRGVMDHSESLRNKDAFHA